MVYFMENPIEIDDFEIFEVPPFQETSICYTDIVGDSSLEFWDRGGE